MTYTFSEWFSIRSAAVECKHHKLKCFSTLTINSLGENATETTKLTMKERVAVVLIVISH